MWKEIWQLKFIHPTLSRIKIKDVKCEICDKVFKSLNVLQVRFNLNQKEKIFKCEKCGETFPFKSYGWFTKPQNQSDISSILSDFDF